MIEPYDAGRSTLYNDDGTPAAQIVTTYYPKEQFYRIRHRWADASQINTGMPTRNADEAHRRHLDTVARLRDGKRRP